MLGKKEITGEICNKVLAYLMFLKWKGIGKVKPEDAQTGDHRGNTSQKEIQARQLYRSTQ